MAVRDVKKYYLTVQTQYFDMLSEIKDFEEEVKKGNIEEPILERAKSMILPLKNNYERLSYIMFLLASPKRDKKKERYLKENKRLYTYLAEQKAIDASIIKEDEDTFKQLKGYLASLDLKAKKKETSTTNGN